MTCFTALILYRILEKKPGESYTSENIIRTLKEMNTLAAPGEGDISEKYEKDFNSDKKVEISLEFKNRTEARKWRNYATYGLLTLN